MTPRIVRDEEGAAPPDAVSTSTATPEASATPTATASATPAVLPQSAAMREVYAKLASTLGTRERVTIVRGDTPEQIAPTTYWVLGEVARREASASVAAPTQVYVSVAVATGVYTLDPTGNFSIDGRACPGATR